MIAGEPYIANDPELWEERVATRKQLRKFNEELEYDDMEGRQALLRQLLGSLDADCPPFIEPPFRCDYGAGRRRTAVTHHEPSSSCFHLRSQCCCPC
jgi:maltose O-acetyltransferase